MQTYLVRSRDSKRLVGIFSAEDSGDLFYAVDESADPFECEYFIMLRGEGVFVDGLFTAAPGVGFNPAITAAPMTLVDAPAKDRESLFTSKILTERLDALEDYGWQGFTRDDSAAVFFLASMCCKTA